MAPRSQKDRPISFVLDDGQGGVKSVALVIRPEDLTRQDVSLLTPTQTFDGGWIDDWGPGLSNIQIAGHTGWGAGSRADGYQAFQDLYSQVWKDWHSKRATAVQQGRDPNSVKLIFADALDGVTSVVAPGSFSLRRNRNRPLLMMYAISMTVISDQVAQADVDPLPLDPNSAAANDLPTAVSSLNASVATLSGANLTALISTSILGPVQKFVGLTQNAFGQVLSTVLGPGGLVGAAAGQIIGVASSLALAGRNLFWTYGAIAMLSTSALASVMAIAAAYENAWCVLNNAMRPPRLYPDYTGLYGSSACSSTFGGDPQSLYLGQNPFESIIDSSTLIPSVSSGGQSGIDALISADPVLSPMSLDSLGVYAGAVAGGVGW